MRRRIRNLWQIFRVLLIFKYVSFIRSIYFQNALPSLLSIDLVYKLGNSHIDWSKFAVAIAYDVCSYTHTHTGNRNRNLSFGFMPYKKFHSKCTAWPNSIRFNWFASTQFAMDRWWIISSYGSVMQSIQIDLICSFVASPMISISDFIHPICLRFPHTQNATLELEKRMMITKFKFGNGHVFVLLNSFLLGLLNHTEMQQSKNLNKQTTIFFMIKLAKIHMCTGVWENKGIAWNFFLIDGDVRFYLCHLNVAESVGLLCCKTLDEQIIWFWICNFFSKEPNPIAQCLDAELLASYTHDRNNCPATFHSPTKTI